MAENGGKKYGLILKKKTTSVQLKPSIFGGDDSGDEEETERKTVNVTIRKEAEKRKQVRQTQIEMNKVLEDDPTAYEYDTVYDKMAERKANLLAAKSAVVEKKPKYIGNLLKFAEARKREEERRIERQVQKEREAEGNEFADKDAFVTSAFRKKMQEMAEEEERQRKRDERDGDVTKQADLSKFYRNLLDKNVSTGGAYDTDEQHTETGEEKRNKSRQSPNSGEQNKKGWSSRERSSKDENKERHNRDREDEIPTSKHEKHEIGYVNRDEKIERDELQREAERTLKKTRERKTHIHDKQQHGKTTHDAKQEHEDEGTVKRGHESENDDRVFNKRSSDEALPDESVESSRKSEDSGGTPDKSMESSRKSEDSTTKEKTKTVNKFAKHSSEETVMSARERYLARKKARVVVTQTGSDDES